MATQEINFKVLSIKEAKKPNHMVAEVQFNNNPQKVYTYVRKQWTHEFSPAITISGCAVEFVRDYLTNEYKVNSIERLYDVAGKKVCRRDDTNKVDEPIEVEPIIEEPYDVTGVIDKIKDKIEKDKDGNVKHEKFDIIKSCLECNIPVYLAGPAGSGKNFTVEQIAKELGWNFYFSNSIQQEFKLTGFIDAGGSFHDTEFFKACMDENDCVFFLDEIDASIPEVLVLLNAAIANGYFEFPTGRVNLDNVHFVAAGNTVGNGADEDYTGRMVIDQATLDRFAIIEFGYDKNIEYEISGGNDKLIDFIHELRKSATDNGIRATFSYRCITMVTKLEKTDMRLVDIIKIAVVKGLDKDTISTLDGGNTKYATALETIKMEAA